MLPCVDCVASQAAIDHLISVGFLSRAEVRRAGGVNLLWGLLLQELNTKVGGVERPALS